MASRSYCCRRLPMDIIHDILIRLRVKTLCKFLCVSKSWYALISDPIFRSSYDRRAKENPFIIASRTCRWDDFHISLLDSKGNLVEKSTIKTSGNAVISVFTCPDLVVVDDCNNVYLRNTITRDVTKMPTRRKYCRVNRYVLAHVPSTKEYKLLAIGHNFNQSYEYEVITIGDDCWRTVSNPPIPAVSTYFGVHVDEAIYMMPEFDSDPYDVKGMVRFDLEREEWSVVPTLSGPRFHGGQFSCILRGTGEKLWVAEWSEEGLFWEREFDLDLWSLKDRDKGVWMKECKVRIPFPDLHPCHFFSPIAIDNDGRVLIKMSKIGSTDKCKLLLCNSDGCKNFQVILEGEFCNCRTSFYVESFEYLKCLAFAKALGTKGERTC